MLEHSDLPKGRQDLVPDLIELEADGARQGQDHDVIARLERRKFLP